MGVEFKWLGVGRNRFCFNFLDKGSASLAEIGDGGFGDSWPGVDLADVVFAELVVFGRDTNVDIELAH